MKVSELIFKLRQAYLEHGDLIVRLDTDEEPECDYVLYLEEGEEEGFHPEAHICLMGKSN